MGYQYAGTCYADKVGAAAAWVSATPYQAFEQSGSIVSHHYAVQPDGSILFTRSVDGVPSGSVTLATESMLPGCDPGQAAVDGAELAMLVGSVWLAAWLFVAFKRAAR